MSVVFGNIFLCSNFVPRAWISSKSYSIWKSYLNFGKFYQLVNPTRNRSRSRSISTLSRKYINCQCQRETSVMERASKNSDTKLCMDSTNQTPAVDLVEKSPLHEGKRVVGDDKPKNSLSKRALKKMARAQKHKEMRKQKKQESHKFVQTADAGFNMDHFDQSSYYFENGLRKVYPYNFVFTTYVKRRWVGRLIKEVLLQEFGFDHPDQLQNTFDSGRLLVNDCEVTSDYVLKDNDFISHQTHRHENPVTSAPLEIIEDNDDVLVINKPSSIPCHPCGRYRFNSVPFILGKDMGYKNLRAIYRLDRLTSGVLIFGKTMERTKFLMDQVSKRQVQKEYVCRVVGRFPDGTVEVDQPLQALSNKLRLQVVSPTGKSSQTTFTRLSYNGQTSVVKCIPHTGRTHQIRVHLQYLGYPIVNDVFYNNIAWGPNKAKDGVYEVPHEKVCERILADHHVALWDGGPNPLYQQKLEEMKLQKSQAISLPDSAEQSINPSNKASDLTEMNFEEASDTSVGANISEQSQISDEPPHKRRKEEESNKKTSTTCVENIADGGNAPGFDVAKLTVDESCEMCKKKNIDPEEKDLVMFLHALKYRGPGWAYETDLPDWAREDWDKDSEYVRKEWCSLEPDEEPSL